MVDLRGYLSSHMVAGRSYPTLSTGLKFSLLSVAGSGGNSPSFHSAERVYIGRQPFLEGRFGDGRVRTANSDDRGKGVTEPIERLK